MGRTQLQDAVPMTLGQEFKAFAETLAGEVRALEAVQRVLCEVNMGATAIGTGLNAPAGYAQKCTAHLAAITGLPIHLASDLIEATQDTQAFVLYSSCMKSLAIKLSKVCNDLRLLVVRAAVRPARDQPAADAARLVDHARQSEPGHPGSREHGLLPRHRQRPDGHDGGRRRAAAAERLRAGHRRLPASRRRRCSSTRRGRCASTASTASRRTRRSAAITSSYSIGTVTALNPVIGYDRSTELAAEAQKTGRGILEIIRERKILTEQQIAEVLDPMAMTGQGRPS